MEELVLFLLVLALAGLVVVWGNDRAKRRRAEQALAQLNQHAYQTFEVGSSQLQQAQAATVNVTRQLDEMTAYARRADGEISSLRKQLETFGQTATGEVARAQSVAEREVAAALRAAATEVASARQHGHAVAARYVADVHDWLVSRMTPSNLETSRSRASKVIAFCAKHGFGLEPSAVEADDQELVAAFKDAVRKDLARQEQQRIKDQIRDEQRAEREFARAAEQTAREESAVQAALAKALQKVGAEHSAEVAALRSQLDALAEKKRAMSLAQQTRAGHVYIISNIGSFGEGIYKIGMTRRYDPQDRVDELGDASVPFPFDVHLMVSSADAPSLENALHREFHPHRVNKANLRKEFFRASLDKIVEAVKRNHGDVDYKATPDAFEYRETAAIVERGGLAHRPEFVEPTLEEQLQDA